MSSVRGRPCTHHASLLLVTGLVVALLGSCTTRSTDRYEYADGSGNRFFITQDRVEYQPVTTADSSSWHYNGGKPASRSLSDADYAELRTRIDAAAQNSAIQIDKRVKGSGVVTLPADGQERQYILRPDAREQEAIELLLKRVLHR